MPDLHGGAPDVPASFVNVLRRALGEGGAETAVAVGLQFDFPSPVEVGDVVKVRVPFPCRIVGNALLEAGQTGSIGVDVSVKAIGGSPSAIGSASISSDDHSLTATSGWSGTTLARDSVVLAEVTTVTTIEDVLLSVPASRLDLKAQL